MARFTACIVTGLLTLAGAAHAQDAADFLASGEERLAAKRPPNLSPDLIGLEALSRFHLTTRMTPGVPDDAVSDDLRFTIIPTAHVRIREGMTLDAVLPLGAYAPHPGENSFVFGNLSVGLSGGGHIFLGTPAPDRITPRLGLGGGIDVLAPTASATGEDRCDLALEVCNPIATLRNLQAYQPELFVEGALFFRARAHIELVVSVFTAELELSLTPGVDIDEDADERFLMLLGWAARASVKAGPYVEPYLELTNAQQMAGENLRIDLNPDLTVRSIVGRDLSTPVMLTIGLRAHFFGMSPALFASIDTRDSLVVFGLDLAGALRPGPQRQEDSQDFLRGPGDADPWD